jgi:hypothetical protein
VSDIPVSTASWESARHGAERPGISDPVSAGDVIAQIESDDVGAFFGERNRIRASMTTGVRCVYGARAVELLVTVPPREPVGASAQRNNVSLRL